MLVSNYQIQGGPDILLHIRAYILQGAGICENLSYTQN